MSIPSSLTPLFSTGSSAAAAEYQIERSLRFNSADSAYLSRTPAVAGNRRTWTWAGWVKRSALSSFQCLFSAGGDDNFGFSDADKFQFYFGGVQRLSTQVFRDTSAWYHLVAVYDSPNATAQNRIRVYVNGSEITAWDTNLTVTQNRDGTVNNTVLHAISYNTSGAGQYFPGYLADIHFIDGQALDYTSFTEVSATTGQLIPKAYTGTYTGNSFWLKFDDNSAATATTLGKDSFLLGNNWTPNNLSVTAGAGNDSLVDTPTSYGTDTGAGGSVRGNYATLNPLANAAGNTLSNGNLECNFPGTASGTANAGPVCATITISSGKWYWEFQNTVSNWYNIGIAPVSVVAGYNFATAPASLVEQAGVLSYYIRNPGYFYTGPSYVQYGSDHAVNDITGVALDLDNGTLTYYKNGVSEGVAATGISGTFVPFFENPTIQPSGGGIVNFGQRAFAYTAPSGFKALCDTNIPEGTITTSGTYTGNGVANGPFVYLNGVPTAMTVGGNAVTFGTHADKLSNGFKLRTTSTTYNQNALSYNYSITATGAKFKYARAQPNP